MVIYKFMHIQHPIDPSKDAYAVEEFSAVEFHGGYVLTSKDNEEDEPVVIGKTAIGVLSKCHMYLLENNPEFFISAIVERTQKNIEFHTQHLENLLQRKAKWVQWLNQRKNARNNALGNLADAVKYWHDNDTGVTLQEFLGLTDEEYEMWGKTSDEDLVNVILSRRDEDK